MSQNHIDETASRITLTSEGADETRRIGQIIGRFLQKGDIIALIGELGSGKTCITQGIARGINVPENYYVTSPTFTLINEYPGRIPLYHLDIYRLSGSQDLIDMGYEEYFYGDGVIIIEWAEKIIDILPDDTLFIHFMYVDENKRTINISGNIQRSEALFKELVKGGI
jgi:tRNA threonylcarbamoyladenosine biosynthesis protein TsaE